MARNACPRESGERAIQVSIRLIRRADARRLGGPVVKHVLGPAHGRTRGPGHDKLGKLLCVI